MYNYIHTRVCVCVDREHDKMILTTGGGYHSVVVVRTLFSIIDRFIIMPSSSPSGAKMIPRTMCVNKTNKK